MFWVDLNTTVRWRSWLSHLSNTQKVPSSSLGRIIARLHICFYHPLRDILTICKHGLVRYQYRYRFLFSHVIWTSRIATSSVSACKTAGSDRRVELLYSLIYAKYCATLGGMSRRFVLSLSLLAWIIPKKVPLESIMPFPPRLRLHVPL